VVGTDAPTDEPAAGDHLYALPSIRQRIADNLALLLTALATFVFSTVLAPLQRLGKWWLVAAASFALAAVVAVLALLRRRSPPRRLQWLAGGLTACAVVTLVAGFVLRPGPVRYDRAATLVLVDTSQVMSERLPDAATKLDAALRSVRMHAVGAYEQLGLASYGVDDCGDRRPYRLRMEISAAGASRVDRAVADLRPGGRSNLAVAARRVLGELQPFSSKDRRLLIVTGGEDSCGGDLAEVVRAARKTDIEVSWDITGLGLTQALPVQPSGSVHLHYANSQAELQTIVTQLLVNDPATREFNQLAEFLHKRVEPELNGASAALDDLKVADADARLKALTSRFEEGDDRFARDPVSARVPECEAVAEFERKQFRRLKEVLPVLADSVEFERKHGDDESEEVTRERKELVDAWNVKVRVYNTESERLPTLIMDCLASLTRPG
jgi:hypothetical protein